MMNVKNLILNGLKYSATELQIHWFLAAALILAIDVAAATMLFPEDVSGFIPANTPAGLSQDRKVT